MLNIFIFSKDRPCQLDALLRSINDHIKITYEATILYTYSNEMYKKGYDQLIEIYKNSIHFIKETNFKRDSLTIIQKDHPLMIGLSDDTLITEDLIYDDNIKYFIENESILGLKLIFGLNITERFGEGIKIPQPNFIDKDHNVWDWSKIRARGFWGYPMSLATQIYRRKDLINYLPTLNYNSPNFMESEMNKHALSSKPLAMCYPKSKMVLIQINRVQQTHINNRHGTIGLEYLNTQWLSGQRIMLEPWYNKINEMNHVFEFLSIDVMLENIK